MGDPGAAADHHVLAAHALGLRQLDQLGEVLDVDILLGDGLAHQQHVGVDLLGLLQKVLVEHLGAEVVALDHLIALQPVVAREALAVHDRVDADGVGVGAGGGPHHDDLAPDVLPDVGVDLLHLHRLVLDGLHLNFRVIDGVGAGAVHDVKRESLVQRPGVGHVRLADAHLLAEQPRGLHALFVVGDGQGEAELHLAVVHRIAVRLQKGKVKRLVKVLGGHVVESRAHACPSPLMASMNGLK